MAKRSLESHLTMIPNGINAQTIRLTTWYARDLRKKLYAISEILLSPVWSASSRRFKRDTLHH